MPELHQFLHRVLGNEDRNRPSDDIRDHSPGMRGVSDSRRRNLAACAGVASVRAQVAALLVAMFVAVGSMIAGMRREADRRDPAREVGCRIEVRRIAPGLHAARAGLAGSQ